jgi:integrase
MDIPPHLRKGGLSMGVKVREKTNGSGEWWVFINYRGQRRARKVGLRSAALDLSKKIKKKINDKEFNLEDPEADPPVLFKDYADKWMKEHVGISCKESTREDYRTILDLYVLPAFGTRALQEIGRDTVRAFCAEKKEAGRATASIKLMLAVTSGVLGYALENNVIASNPASRAGKFLRREDRRAKVEFLSREEADSLLEAAREHHPRFYPLLLTALRTGLRIGELLALQWGDVDWHGKFIEVRRNVWRKSISTPKSGRLRRVDMSDQLAVVLRYHRRKIAEEAIGKGRPISEWAFPAPEGGLQRPDKVRVYFRACLKEAKLREIPFHALRHTYASLLIANGESLAYVKEQMGHHSIQITVDVYGHLIPGANRQAVNRLDDPSWREKSGKSATLPQPGKEEERKQTVFQR